jgi:cytochrome c-type biogenesis protein CcmE
LRLLIVLIVAALIVLAIYLLLDSLRRRGEMRAPWKVDTFNRPDGTTVVGLRRSGSAERVVKELPPGMDPVDFESELRIALEDAESHARTLNRQSR